MASLNVEEVFKCKKEDLYAVITDYNKYSEFVPDVNQCVVIESEGNRHLVEYEVSLIKKFKYRLWTEENGSDEVSWSLESGDLFKVSNGFWKLSNQEDGKTLAKYHLEVEFKMFAPNVLLKKAINLSVPKMMKAYQQRVSEKF